MSGYDNSSKFLGCSQDVFHSGPEQSEFCTRENWQTAVLYLAQEMELLGLPSPCIKGQEEENQSSLDVITLVNSSWKVVQMYRNTQRSLIELESLARRTSADRDRLLANIAKQKETLEHRERAVAESNEKERQAGEIIECGQQKLKAAKDELRKLMGVLLQRESKYSHEIRKSEQENARLKERLLKVLVDKGEGKGGCGAGIDVVGGLPGKSGSRARWATDQNTAKREEEFYSRVVEELTRREELAVKSLQETQETLSEALSMIKDLVRDFVADLSSCEDSSSIDLDPDAQLVCVRTLLQRLRSYLNESLSSENARVLEEKLSLYEKKLVLYEQIIQSYESNRDKDKLEGLLRGLSEAQNASLQERLDHLAEADSSRRQMEAERDEITKAHEELEKWKEMALWSDFEQSQRRDGIDKQSASHQIPAILQLPRQTVEAPPSWAMGPVTVTPASLRSGDSGTGCVLGYTGPNSRPVSRPGSQPGSRAPSLSRDIAKQNKGKSPSASLINRRTGRMSDGAASLGRKMRPKSANMSPNRSSRDLISPVNTISRRTSAGAASRSPSVTRESTGQRDAHSRSLPRGQLSLRQQGQPKRGSGVWSKPPTPGPYSPSVSDNEYGYLSK